jgi:hypothetical protein
VGDGNMRIGRMGVNSDHMKKIYYLFFGGLLLIICLYIFHEDLTEEKVDVEQKLIAMVEKKRLTGEKVVIDFKQVAPFEWDKVYIFKPYTDDEFIYQALGFEWNNSVLGVLLREDTDLLLFVKGKKVIGYVKHARENGDFEIGEKMGFLPNEALFEVVKGHYAEPGWFTIRHIN